MTNCNLGQAGLANGQSGKVASMHSAAAGEEGQVRRGRGSTHSRSRAIVVWIRHIFGNNLRIGNGDIKYMESCW